MGHKDYTKENEVLISILPIIHIDTISDYFKNNLSVNDVLNIFRIDGHKITSSLVKEVYKHIQTIEDTIIRILNGTSIVYELYSDTVNPSTLDELKAIFTIILTIDKDKYNNVYETTDLVDLNDNINHIIDNVIEINTDFDTLKNSIPTNEEELPL